MTLVKTNTTNKNYCHATCGKSTLVTWSHTRNKQDCSLLKCMFGVSHRLDTQRMKRAESDGGRYLNSNTGISFLFCSFGCLKVSTILKTKGWGRKSRKPILLLLGRTQEPVRSSSGHRIKEQCREEKANSEGQQKRG